MLHTPIRITGQELIFEKNCVNLEMNNSVDIPFKSVLGISNFHKPSTGYSNKNEFKKSYICQANLRMASLFKANLEGAEIVGSSFCNSNLTEANLKNSNCRGTDFEGAILVRANLQGVDLLSTFLEDADLRYANLKNAKNLSIEQLQGAKTLFQAKLDPKLMELVKTTNPNLLKEPQK